MRQNTIISLVVFFKPYPIPFLRICISNVGLKSHTPAPYIFCSKSRLTPPPPPNFSRSIYHPPSSGVTYVILLFPPKYSTSTLATIMFIINCTTPYPYLGIRLHPNPREDAGGLSREYVLRIPSVS